MESVTLTEGINSRWYFNFFYLYFFTASPTSSDGCFFSSRLFHLTSLRRSRNCTLRWAEGLSEALCLTKPITSKVNRGCQLNLTEGGKKRPWGLNRSVGGLCELHSMSLKLLFSPLPLKGSSYLIGQAVLWLHPWHHSHHPRCTHQQLWNYQASGAERRVHAAAARGGWTQRVCSINCIRVLRLLSVWNPISTGVKWKSWSKLLIWLYPAGLWKCCISNVSGIDADDTKLQIYSGWHWILFVKNVIQMIDTNLI